MVSQSRISLRRIGSSWILLFLLYAYGTMHFGFAVPSIFGFQDRNVVVELHLYSTPVMPKIFAMLFWISAFLVLLAKLPEGKRFKPSIASRYLIRMFWLLLVLVAIWFGSLMTSFFRVDDGSPVSWLKLKGAASAVATWATALAGALALLSDSRASTKKNSDRNSKAVGLLLLSLVIVVSVIAFAELWTGLAYSSENREMYVASRASGTLFNPNVLGLWAAFTTIGVALLYCEQVISRSVMFPLCILLAFVTLAAGSRSAFIPLVAAWMLLLFGLSIGASFQLRRAAMAGLVWAFSLAFFPLVAHIAKMLGANSNLIESLIWDGNRLFGSFSVALIYVLSLFSVLPEGWAVLPENAQMSMDGRFASDGFGVDNDYLAILASGGWVVLAIWLSLWLFAALQALASFWQIRHRRFIYAGVLIVLSGMAGLGMRATQLFPVSIFIAIALAWAFYLTSQKPN